MGTGGAECPERAGMRVARRSGSFAGRERSVGRRYAGPAEAEESEAERLPLDARPRDPGDAEDEAGLRAMATWYMASS